jgi:hypothetical protein
MILLESWYTYQGRVIMLVSCIHSLAAYTPLVQGAMPCCQGITRCNDQGKSVQRNLPPVQWEITDRNLQNVNELHLLFWPLISFFSFCFGSTTTDLTWQAVGITKSSSLAEGWQDKPFFLQQQLVEFTLHSNNNKPLNGFNLKERVPHEKRR